MSKIYVVQGKKQDTSAWSELPYPQFYRQLTSELQNNEDVPRKMCLNSKMVGSFVETAVCL